MTLPPLETPADYIGLALSIAWSAAALACFLVATLHDPNNGPDR